MSDAYEPRILHDEHGHYLALVKPNRDRDVKPAESLALDLERMVRELDALLVKHGPALAELDRGHGYVGGSLRDVRRRVGAIALGLAPELVNRRLIEGRP